MVSDETDVAETTTPSTEAPTEMSTEVSTSEPTGVVEEESTSETKSDVEANVGGNTITTGTGFTFPVLENFNSSGMNINNSWAGPWGEVDAAMQTMFDTLDAFGVHNSGASNDFFMVYHIQKNIVEAI